MTAAVFSLTNVGRSAPFSTNDGQTRPGPAQGDMEVCGPW